MAKFRNKYRIESTRLKGWDYRNAGAYFITICTDGRLHHFGECQGGQMKLSAAGLLVQGCWYEIPRLNPNVELGEFIVMPNHIHGILILVDDNNNHTDVDDNPDKSSKNEYFKNISPKSGSVSRIIQQFKRACSHHIKCTMPDLDFRWQSLFHDHIIRSEDAFLRISDYINNNPSKWEADRFFHTKNSPTP